MHFFPPPCVPPSISFSISGNDLDYEVALAQFGAEVLWLVFFLVPLVIWDAYYLCQGETKMRPNSTTKANINHVEFVAMLSESRGEKGKGEGALTDLVAFLFKQHTLHQGA